MRDWYTTAEVAKVLCVSPHTAARLIDSRQIRALVVPGGGASGRKIRRVRHADLVKFAAEHGFPIDHKPEGVR